VATDKPNLREAIERIKRLPTLPTVLGQILDTAADPDASALDLGRHITSDQSLSAAVLRLVNSPYFGFYRQIESIPDAVALLGFNEVRNLALTSTAFAAFPRNKSAYDRTQLWRHSLVSAMAAERCARQMKLPADAGYFSAGLLHDIGKVTLDMLYPDLFRRAGNMSHDEGIPLYLAEREVFGIDHAETGGMLAEHWNLPTQVVEAIRHHHDVEGYPSDSPLPPASALSDYVAYQGGYGESSNGQEPALPTWALERLNTKESHCVAVVKDLGKANERVTALLSVLESA